MIELTPSKNTHIVLKRNPTQHSINLLVHFLRSLPGLQSSSPSNLDNWAKGLFGLLTTIAEGDGQRFHIDSEHLAKILCFHTGRGMSEVQGAYLNRLVSVIEDAVSGSGV